MLLRIKLMASAAAIAVMTGPALADGHGEMTAETVVASVDGVDITLGQLIVLRSQLPDQYSTLDDATIFNGLIDQLVNQQLLANSVGETPLSVELDLANQRRTIMAQRAISEYENLEFSAEDLQAEYDAAVAEQGQEYNAAHILVETEEEALEIKTLVDDGADFAATAQERSTGPSGPNGGNLGWFGEGMMVPEFEAAVMALDVDEVSDPVETQFGWHVIKLNETRQAEFPPLEQVADQLTQQLQADAFAARLEELTQAADIVLPEDGAFDPSVLNNTDLVAD
ncbi:MAG: peptidylprolyl isomerase [Pseudomonadota bacterium]